MKRTMLQSVFAPSPPLPNPLPRGGGEGTEKSGITLLEMVLALSLFLGAITVLAQVVWNGQRAAMQGRLQTEAAFRCESQLAEILAGAQPFLPQQNVAFSDDPQWTWSADIGPGNLPELMHLKVTVHHASNNPAANADFTLERWTRDPTLFTQSALQAQQAASKSSSSSSSSSSSAGGMR